MLDVLRQHKRRGRQVFVLGKGPDGFGSNRFPGRDVAGLQRGNTRVVTAPAKPQPFVAFRAAVGWVAGFTARLAGADAAARFVFRVGCSAKGCMVQDRVRRPPFQRPFTNIVSGRLFDLVRLSIFAAPLIHRVGVRLVVELTESRHFFLPRSLVVEPPVYLPVTRKPVKLTP